MFEFDRDTRVERVSEGRYVGLLDRGWNIGDNPNGGSCYRLFQPPALMRSSTRIRFHSPPTICDLGWGVKRFKLNSRWFEKAEP